MTAPVEVRGLRKSYRDEGRGEVAAVDGVDFDCAAGEVFGLLGANGAGKTTTLRILSTVLAPDAGSASVMGWEVSSHPDEVRRRLGFYSATTALYPKLTARETLEFFGRLGGLSKARARERTEALLERFGMKEWADARVEALSQGMRQKVSIARTVVHDPPVLIFDEPTVGLDVLAALEIRKAIAELRSEGKCVVFSTHVMSEAEKLCDRIAILHRGRIRALGTLDELRAATGLRYLEDIFVRHVEAAGG